jgi:hypothetical protein
VTDTVKSVLIGLIVGALSFGICFVVFIILELKTGCISLGPCGFGEGVKHGSLLDEGLTCFVFAGPIVLGATTYFYSQRIAQRRQASLKNAGTSKSEGC